MARYFDSLWVLAALCCGQAGSAVAAGPAGAASAPAAVAVADEPLAAPAMRVTHAASAAVLAGARAGARVVAVGERGVVMLSDDMGKSFRQARQVPIDATLTSVSFVDDRHGWAVGHWGVVLVTQDGGETWALQRKDAKTDRPLFAVHFFDARQGVAAGLWSLVLTTNDGGATWRQVELKPPEGAKKADLNLLGLFADGQGRVFAAAERGMVLRSDDRGASWTYTATGYKGSFWSGLALPGGVLLAGGLRGALYRSGDDGRSWTRLDTGSKSSITALAGHEREVLAVGLDGLVLRSTDSGASFTSEPRADRAALTSVITVGPGRAIYFSRQGALTAQTPASTK
jgi:photosystem II stability/assembly factor-like uncharacterized protein